MKKTPASEKLSPAQREDLLKTLRARFEKNAKRHRGIKWVDVLGRLEANAGKLWSLHVMEETGGEPDVVGQDKKTGEYFFFDCAKESPKGRRSVCYDQEALVSRKDFPPEDSAVAMAAAMSIDLLTEEEYFELQTLGDFDTTTSSWIKTPAEFRAQGGALFADRRYGRVFVYQNSAPVYYRVRGFRGVLRV